MKNPLPGPRAARRWLIGLFIVWQAGLIFVTKHDALDLDIGPNTQSTENIYQDNRVGQTFIAKRNGLARIDIALGTHGRTNRGTVFFRLWEETPERRLLREVTFNTATVKNNQFYAVRFKPVRRSFGRKYLFVLASAESTYENSICAWMNRRDIYPEGEYYFRQRPQGGDLMFRAYSRQTVAAELGRMVRKYGGALGSPVALAAAALFFIIIATAVFSKLLDLVLRIGSERPPLRGRT